MEENNKIFDDEEEELYEHFSLDVDPGQTPMRLDKLLAIHLKKSSRNKIQNAIDSQSVRVNGQVVKSSYKPKPGDRIVVALPKPPREPTEILPENIPLNIVYEDEAVLIVNKDAQMVVHPGFANWDGTLVNALVYHFGQLPTSKNGAIRPGLVHRIDKGTSGLLVIAKTEYAMQHLARQFADHSTERTYYALIWGEPEQDKGTINAKLGRSQKDRRVTEVYEDGGYGREAITHYEVLKRMRYVSLVKCNLETGRTHQIRAHMKYIGHPLFGDATYGGDRILRGNMFSKYKQFVENCFQILPRQALHAKSLGFEHPEKKEWMQFDSELPEDMQTLLEKWEAYVQHV
ncbi:RluA family pseudouridine synthase [Marinilongibacter aquaticus]|uniref:RluA family pseudouridine synthase n=1 Tax=Marinilongibacter aquaticus TaxID=2975157 RepID=UPI0021BDDDC2|nr:RluA family pseudouridine synthase [Marinilongibacter aquaticus]UBM59941.1 RluA family pseudouridine synthase [Marinilongibacter aquaticus]